MTKKIPLRQCVGCREMKPKNELIRLIRTPENTVCLDKTGKMNGRGAYLCPNAVCFQQAVKKNAWNRALNMQISDEVYETLSRELNEN